MKSRKGNGDCGKNKENTREIWSSIEKGSRENEITSKQEKKRD